MKKKYPMHHCMVLFIMILGTLNIVEKESLSTEEKTSYLTQTWLPQKSDLANSARQFSSKGGEKKKIFLFKNHGLKKMNGLHSAKLRMGVGVKFV